MLNDTFDDDMASSFAGRLHRAVPAAAIQCSLPLGAVLGPLGPFRVLGPLGPFSYVFGKPDFHIWSRLREFGAHTPDPDLESFKTRLRDILRRARDGVGDR